MEIRKEETSLLILSWSTETTLVFDIYTSDFTTVIKEFITSIIPKSFTDILIY